jgi:hypothetical protein
MKKVRFIKSPIGRFSLAYFEGDVASLDDKQADELTEEGYAVLAAEKKPEKKVEK